MLILIVTFLAFFLAIVLAAFAVAAPRSKELKQTMSRLKAIEAPQAEDDSDETLSFRRVEHFSSLPWLDRWLRDLNIAGRLRLLLYQAELKWSVGKLVLSAVLLGLVCGQVTYARTRAAALGVLLAAAGGSAPFLFVLLKRSRRFEQMRQGLPEALDLMVSAIRAGHSLPSAVGMAAKECAEPVRREFRQCFDEQNFGLDLRDALLNLQHRMPIGEVRMIVTAVLIQTESGGNLTEILEKVAWLIRENVRLRRQVMVHTAQGRMTGVILALLPPILGILLYMANPEQMSILWTHPTGRKALGGAIVMTAIGGLLIRKIVRVRI